MAWIKTVGEEEARGELREIYAELRRERGKIANILKVHSLDPSSLKLHMNLYIHLLFSDSGLSREERELVAVTVSKVNECTYCVRHHSEALNHYWCDDQRIEDLLSNRDPELTSRVGAILGYATKLTSAPGEVNSDDLEGLREHGLNDLDILRLNLIVSYFNFVNRIALGLGVEFTPEEISGYNY
jgi:uncharacterized peroxidase-related enzyme